MNGKFLFCGFLFVYVFTATIFGQWEQAINGMGNQPVTALLAEGDTLYASTNFDLLKSTDQGDNWVSIGNGLPSWKNFYSIVRSGNYLVAGGESPGMWLSSNNGVDWFQTTSGLDADEFVFFLYADGNYVYAALGSPASVAVSSDNGNTWTKSSNGLQTTQYISGITKIGSTLYAVHSIMGVYTSTDNGVNWQHTFAGGIGAQDKNAIIKMGNNLCVAATNGVWTKPDTSNNWYHTLTAGIMTGFGVYGNELYVVGQLPYKSLDNGMNWFEVDVTGLSTFIQNTMQFTSNYALINTYGIGVYRRNISQVTPVESLTPDQAPKTFLLEQNYPNPFNPGTRIKYAIPSVIASETKQSIQTSLKIYDVLGGEVAALVNEEKSTGIYEIDFNASSLPSGVYFYKLQAGSFSETKKMVLMK